MLYRAALQWPSVIQCYLCGHTAQVFVLAGRLGLLGCIVPMAFIAHPTYLTTYLATGCIRQQPCFAAHGWTRIGCNLESAAQLTKVEQDNTRAPTVRPVVADKSRPFHDVLTSSSLMACAGPSFARAPIVTDRLRLCGHVLTSSS